MVERRYQGRVTVDDRGMVIGTGGSQIAEEYRVEDILGKIVGITSFNEVEAALIEQRALRYEKISVRR